MWSVCGKSILCQAAGTPWARAAWLLRLLLSSASGNTAVTCSPEGMKCAVHMVLVDESASITELGKWKCRPMFPASFSDLHEPRGDPVQGPFNQSRHLQPGGHAHPHADGYPALGEALPSFSLSLLPVHSKWGSPKAEGGGEFQLLRRAILLPVTLIPEGDGGELVTHERQLKVLPTWKEPHSHKEGIAILVGTY